MEENEKWGLSREEIEARLRKDFRHREDEGFDLHFLPVGRKLWCCGGPARRKQMSTGHLQ